MPSSDIPTTHPRPSPTTPASSSSRFSSVVQVVWVDRCEAVWHHCATVSKKKKKKVWYHCPIVSGAFWMDGVHPAHCLASPHAGQLSTSLLFSAKAAGLTRSGIFLKTRTQLLAVWSLWLAGELSMRVVLASPTFFTRWHFGKENCGGLCNFSLPRWMCLL